MGTKQLKGIKSGERWMGRAGRGARGERGRLRGRLSLM